MEGQSNQYERRDVIISGQSWAAALPAHPAIGRSVRQAMTGGNVESGEECGQQPGPHGHRLLERLKMTFCG